MNSQQRPTNSMETDNNDDDFDIPLLTPQRRRQIRDEYRDIITTAEGLAKDYAPGNVPLNSIREGIQRACSIFNTGDVVYPAEAVLDSEAMKQLSGLLKGRVLANKSESAGPEFDLNDFSKNLLIAVDAFNDEDDDDDGLSQLAEFGETTKQLLRCPPTFGVVSGKYMQEHKEKEPEIVELQKIPDQGRSAQTQATQEKPKRKVVPKLKNEKVALAKPKEVAEPSETQAGDETAVLVNMVHEQLKSVYEKNEGRPIPYFEFVLDPTSFEKSVENMFYFSFLVKDGRAGLGLDNFGLPIIRLPEGAPNFQAAAEGDDGNRKQIILKMNKKTWKDLVEAFDIEEAMLQYE